MNHLNKIQKTLITLGMTTLFTAGSFAATNNNTVTPAEREKIESVVHDYLLKKPEIMIEVMQLLQKKEYDQTQQAVKQTQQTAPSFANALFHQANDPVAGNPSGKVALVEFFDYQCPHCVDMAPIITSLIQANPDIKVIYKEFPIRGAVSEYAARAALAANKQGKYMAFSHALLAASQTLTKDSILKIAKDNGLDVEQLKKDMENDNIKNQLKANIKLAQDLKLFGTPAFFLQVQGKDAITYFPGKTDSAQLQTIINKAK